MECLKLGTHSKQRQIVTTVTTSNNFNLPSYGYGESIYLFYFIRFTCRICYSTKRLDCIIIKTPSAFSK